jgi:hypothetical protein
MILRRAPARADAPAAPFFHDNLQDFAIIPPIGAHGERSRTNLKPCANSARESARSNLQFVTLRARIEEEAKFWRSPRLHGV